MPKVDIAPLLKNVFRNSNITLGISASHPMSVATLALGSRPRQRGCKVTGQDEGSPGVKAKALQGCGPRRSPGVTSQTPGSVREC